MTPAIKLAIKQKIKHQVHEYEHDPRAASYGMEACEKLNLDATRVFKTLVVNTGNELVVAIIPVDCKLDLKAIAKAVKAKRAVMAEPKEVERVTGYVLGGVSPLGQKKRLKTVLDESAMVQSTIFVSAGRRGLEIELSPQDLVASLNAHSSSIKN